MQNDTPTEQRPPRQPRLVVAGASGSIGTAVCRDLAEAYEIVALTRFDVSPESPESDLPITWCRCDMFARGEVQAALSGAEYAIYLVHTRLPSARLDQAQCEDMDLLIADNFALAASKIGAKQIVCLRGLLPDGEMPPDRVRQRNEVIEALGAYGTPVTVLRASLVVAPGSTGVKLIASLVQRTPLVPVPGWALGRKQPIALSDVLRAIRHCLGNSETFGGHFDIGGPVVADWRQILEAAAELLGRTPRIVTVPWMPRRLYRLWVRLVSRSTHPALVRLLVEGLQYETVAKDNPVQRTIGEGALLPRQALEPYLEGGNERALRNPRGAVLRIHETQLRESRTVRSIQRITLPPGCDANWAAEQYFGWLPKFVWPFVACETDAGGSCRIDIRFPRLRLLTLTFQPSHSTSDRRMYFITGGLLAAGQRNSRGRMEFHRVLDGRYCIVAIHDFAPALPWNFYHYTQAVAHGFVMRAFQRHMARLAAR